MADKKIGNDNWNKSFIPRDFENREPDYRYPNEEYRLCTST